MKTLRTSKKAKVTAFILCVLCLTMALACRWPLHWLGGMEAGYGWEHYQDRVEEMILENWVTPIQDTVQNWYHDNEFPEDADQEVRKQLGYISSWTGGDPNLFFTVRGEDGRLIYGSETLGDYRAKYAETVTLPEAVKVSETFDTAEERDAALDALAEQYDEVDTDGMDDVKEGPFPLKAVCLNYDSGETLTVSGFIRASMTPTGQTWSQLNQAAHLYNARTVYQAIIPAGIVLGLFCLAFLFRSTGYERAGEGVTLNAFDRKAPIDLMLPIAIIALICWLAVGLDDTGFWTVPDLFPVSFFLFLCPAFAFGLYVLLSAARRIKAKEPQKGSLFFTKAVRLCGRGFRFLGRKLDALADRLPLFWLAAVVFLAFAFLEGLSVIAIANGNFGGVVFWFLLKAVEIAGVIWLVLSFRHLQEGGKELAAGNLDYQVPLTGLKGPFLTHAKDLNRISAAIQTAVEERMKSERMKTELITNVSHDIKTPLTSIVSYVDLLKKQKMPTKEAEEYLEVLDRQSARLKKLTEDLVEASKASTGNIPVNLERTDVNVLLAQSAGEYQERLSGNNLKLVLSPAEGNPCIMADGRLLWRVFDNLLSNIEKYAQPGTRVYLSSASDGDRVSILFRNISALPLNISAEELLERFVRGDESRSTEGSGLGLAIAQDLTRLQGGTFRLAIDGDLFKAELRFPIVK